MEHKKQHQLNNSYSRNSRTVRSSVFCAVRASGCMTVQHHSCKQRCTSRGPMGQMNQSAVSLQAARPVQVRGCCEAVALHGGVGGRGNPIVVSCYVATLSSVVRQSPASKDMNTEDEEGTAVQTVTIQPVKIQQTEKV
jgi:hypothetical protein